MANKKVSIDFNVRGTNVRIQGAEYFYNDAGVRGEIGADLTDDNDLNGQVIIDKRVQYQRLLVQLIAVMKGSLVANAGSSAQNSSTRYFKFWCNPAKVDDAYKNLPGTDIDANLLPGDWKITKIMSVVDSNLA
ncbi:MAG: hypothetical protein ACRCVX_03520 [Shewanella sp.]